MDHATRAQAHLTRIVTGMEDLASQALCLEPTLRATGVDGWVVEELLEAGDDLGRGLQHLRTLRRALRDYRTLASTPGKGIR